MTDDLHDEMKAMLLRYWLSRPASERIQTAMEMSIEAYYRKHPDTEPPRGWDKAKVEFLPFPTPEDEDYPKE